MARAKKQLLFVLGMHRSGTSAMTGVLTLLGAPDPATPMASQQENAKGFFESIPVMEVNDAILASGHSAWNDWGEFVPPSDIEAQFGPRIVDVLLREFGDAPFVAVKDPRICRIFPIWLPVVKAAGYSAHVILPYRHPLEVAESLHARNGVSIAEGLLLWLRHVVDAEFESRGTPRVFVTMTDLLDDWRGCIDTIAAQLKVTWPKDPSDMAVEIDAFLDKGMRHNKHSPDGLHADPLLMGWAAEAFDILNALRDADNPASRKKMDDIRVEFNRATRLFEPAVDAIRSRAEADLSQLGEVAKVADARVKALEDQVKAANDTHSHALADAAQTLAGVRQDMAVLEARLSIERDQAREAADMERGRAKDAADAAKTELETLRHALADLQAVCAAERSRFAAESDASTKAVEQIRADARELVETSQAEALAANEKLAAANSGAAVEIARLQTQLDLQSQAAEAANVTIKAAQAAAEATAAQAEARRAADLHEFTETLTGMRLAASAESERLAGHLDTLQRTFQEEIARHDAALSEEKTRIAALQSTLAGREGVLRQYREAAAGEFLGWAMKRDARP